MFNKNKLAAGIAVGVLGIIGITASVKAVHVNPDGTGQVLIFPYFNANPGYLTNINLVNSTDETKAVKIRFREGKNSHDVLDFNLYLSPEDVWTGSIKLGDDGNGNQVGSFSTVDRSCAIPVAAAADCTEENCEVEKPFHGHEVYTEMSPEDTREGYVEVIEMGVVTDPELQAAAKHTHGKPKDCSALFTAWENGTFKPGRGADATGLSRPTGGLFGSSAILNVTEGTAVAVDPVAIDNYSTEAQHYRPYMADEYLLPSLASGNVTHSTITVPKANGQTDLVVTNWNKQPDTCLNDDNSLTGPCGDNPYPISHVLSVPYLMNEYFLDPTNNYDGHTDWVISFPMKKHGIHQGAQDVMAQFDGIFDREEDRAGGLNTVQDDYFGFSPPIGVNETVSQSSVLDREVNVLTFVSEDPMYDKNRTVLGSPSAMTMSTGPFVHGWARLGFSGYSLAGGYASSQAYGANPGVYNATSPIYQGVPAIGFAVIEGDLSNNPNARYGDAVPHKTRRY